MPALSLLILFTIVTISDTTSTLDTLPAIAPLLRTADYEPAYNLTPPRDGYTFDFCRDTSDCRSHRRCTPAIGNKKGCHHPLSCQCTPRQFRHCSNHGDHGCPPGETCVKTHATPLFCISKKYVHFVRVAFEDADVFTPRRTKLPKCRVPRNTIRTASNRGPALTGAPCKESGDCASPRVCLREGTGEPPTCCTKGMRNGRCVCRHPRVRSCRSSFGCPLGEVCVRGDFWPAQCADPYVLQGLLFAGIVPVDHEPERSGGVVDVTTVLSEDDLYESPHIEYEYICIEVTLLKGYERRELVYDEHRFAKVLCDAQGNCATKGHMVVFQDAPMMMSTYCAGKCTERVAKVNSPRWTRGLRVPSKKIGLSFTAFAARHGTNIEETFLAAAVRVGL